MVSQRVKFGVDARDRMCAAWTSSQCRQGDARPQGRNVVLDKSFGAPRITKDASPSPRKSSLTTSSRNMGAQMVREGCPRSR